MRRFFVSLLFILFLSACSIDQIWFVVIDKDADTVTQVTPTITATISPTIAATPTPTISPTIVPTLDPTPTQEVGNRIRISVNSNIRTAPPVSSFIRVAPANSTFTVFAQRSASGVCATQWLDIGNGEWLCNGSWVVFIAGGLNQVPHSQQARLSRIGYNTLEVFDESYYINHLSVICPAYMLVMDNLPLADRVYRALHESCGTEVIHRSWHPSDGNEYLLRTADDFVSQWQREGYPHLIRYTTNEVSCSGLNCIRYVTQEVEIARLARERGFTVVLGNMGVGKYSPSDVLAGVYNPLVQAALDYGHYLGFHEYTGICLCFGFGQMPTSHLATPQLMQPDLWSTNVQYAFASFAAQQVNDELPFGQEQLNAYYDTQVMAQAFAQATCGNLPSYWHMGRSFWILLWYECTTDDTRIPTVVMTEFGWDRLDDISSVVNPLQNQFASPQWGNNLRGWRSLENVWSWYWADWTPAQAAYEQLAYAMDLYPDNYYALLFAWSDSSTRDWTRAGFSYGKYGDTQALDLHQLFEENPIN